MSSQTLYDPPSGWRYGFPKPYAPQPGESLADTLLRDGYPQHEIDNGGAKYCRFIGWDLGEEIANDNDPIDTTARTAVEAECVRQPAPRIGDWMQTFTGKAVYPMDLRPDDICIEDIAHALSMLCRYNGHSQRFYSVAEHSVLIARHLRQKHSDAVALEGLLHDATEAYLADVPRPVKPFLQGYKEAEHRAWLAIAERYDMWSLYDNHPSVHDADARILHDERQQNMAASENDWGLTGVRLGVQLQFWPPERAKAEFLALFAELYGEE